MFLKSLVFGGSNNSVPYLFLPFRLVGDQSFTVTLSVYQGPEESGAPFTIETCWCVRVPGKRWDQEGVDKHNRDTKRKDWEE